MRSIRQREVLNRAVLADDTTHDVRVIFSDRVRYDADRSKRGLPLAHEAPTTASAYQTWVALRREHKLSLSWDEFCQQLVEIQTVTANGDEVFWRDGHPFVDDEPLTIEPAEHFDDADPTTPTTPVGF